MKMSNVYRTAEESGASVEELIILCCIRLQAGTHEVNQLEKLLQSGVDWEALVRLARAWYFYLGPLLYQQLCTRCPTLVPPAVLEQLHSDYQSNAEHNKMLIRDLLTIVERFNREGIPIIPYKDPLSAHSAYGNVALRVCTDLDVFVRENDVELASHVLKALGYTRVPRVDAIEGELEVAIFYECDFAKNPAELHARDDQELAALPFDFENDRIGKVELHWNFLPRQWSVTRNNTSLWERAKTFLIDGTRVCSFSPEDALLLACIHGAKHGWQWWNLLNDVATLITANTDLNWNQLVTIARQRGCLRILTVGLLLANEVAGAPLPEDIIPRLDHDPRTRAYVERVALRLYHREAAWHPDFAENAFDGLAETTFNRDFPGLRYALFMQERARDKCRSLLRVMLLPNHQDVKMLPAFASRKKMLYLLHPALLMIWLLLYRFKL